MAPSHHGTPKSVIIFGGCAGISQKSEFLEKPSMARSLEAVKPHVANVSREKRGGRAAERIFERMGPILLFEIMYGYDVERLRRMLNNVVHGLEMPHPTDLREAAKELEGLRVKLSGGKPA